MTALLTVAAVLAAVAAVVVWWLLARAGHPWIGLGLSLVTVGSVAVATVVIGNPLGLGSFGVLHVLYLGFVVAVPLLGAAVVVFAGRVGGDSARGLRVAGAVLVLPAVIGLVATHVAPFRLRVEHVAAPVAETRVGSDTLRIAVLSDIQTTGVGDLEREAVHAAMASEPDVIVLPGDLFQGDSEALRREAPALRELLAELDAPGGVYWVQGDVDHPSAYDLMLPPSIRRLEDEVIEVEVGDRTLRIGGTRRDHETPAADAVRRDLVAAGGGPATTVLLSHRPDTVLGLPPSSGVDLTVAGHTHGGQVSLPFIGPLITLSDVPRRVGAGGLHEVNGNPIYVSPGIGMERGQAPQMRLGVPPTVGIVDLG